MKVWRGLQQVPSGLPHPVVTIGNFDGVHLGHRRILELVTRRAAESAGTPLAITFDPHPTRVLAPERAPRLLTPLPQRLELLAQAGIAAVLVLEFTSELSRLSPEEFARRVLVERIGAREVVVGDNFRFGHKQTGDVRVLEGLGAELSFAVHAVPAVRLRGQVVSSSRIRDLVAQGHVSLANRLLGRCFSLRGRIVPGHRRGRTQTVPTLNLEPYADLLPAVGVYATETACDGGRAISVTNVGYSPTFALHELRVESFLIETPPAPGADQMEVFFWRRLRGEVQFPGSEALRQQIARDVSATRAFFRRLRKPETARP